NDFAEHLRGFVITGPTVVKRTQPAVSGPIVRAQINGLPIGFFGLRELTEAFVGPGQAAGGVVVSGLELGGAFELRNGILVAACSRVQRSETFVSGGQFVVQTKGLFTGIPTVLHPPRI